MSDLDDLEKKWDNALLTEEIRRKELIRVITNVRSENGIPMMMNSIAKFTKSLLESQRISREFFEIAERSKNVLLR